VLENFEILIFRKGATVEFCHLSESCNSCQSWTWPQAPVPHTDRERER